MFSVQRELNYLKPMAVLHQLTGKRLTATIMTFPKLGYKAQRNHGRESCRRKEPGTVICYQSCNKACFPSTCHSLLLNLTTVSSNENVMSSLETVAWTHPSSPRAATNKPGDAPPLGPHSEAITPLTQRTDGFSTTASTLLISKSSTQRHRPVTPAPRSPRQEHRPETSHTFPTHLQYGTHVLVTHMYACACACTHTHLPKTRDTGQ